MKISKTQLRTIIKEELAALQVEAEMSRRSALGLVGGSVAGLAGGVAAAKEAGIPDKFGGKIKQAILRRGHAFLGDAEQSLAVYLKNSADDLADKVVPDIPFDGDIIESFMKRTISSAISANAEEIAECMMKFVTPSFLASLSNMDDKTAQRYAE